MNECFHKAEEMLWVVWHTMACTVVMTTVVVGAFLSSRVVPPVLFITTPIPLAASNLCTGINMVTMSGIMEALMFDISFSGLAQSTH